MKNRKDSQPKTLPFLQKQERNSNPPPFHPRPLLSIPDIIPVSLTILSVRKRDRQAKKIAPAKTDLGTLW
jgi:hypothetical protein